MRRFVPAVVLAALIAAVPGVSLAEADGHAEGTTAPPGILDPKLRDEIERRLEQFGTEGGPPPRIPVEMVTGATGAAAAAARSAGARVTGGVPGHVVQIDAPVTALAHLATSPSAGYLRYPRRVSHLPALESSPGTGTPGAAIAITNADEWQDAGFTGAGVRIGVIDFFNFNLWLPAESGPLPDAAHQFCRDSIISPPDPTSYCLTNGTVNSLQGDVHGDAVIEIVKDLAPNAEVFVATVATVSDLQAAIDWMAGNGVTVVTRSLGAAYDGPGDGTGPLAAVVDSAVAQGITWFNSAGNAAAGAYHRVLVPTNLPGGGYVDFDPGPGVDTFLRIDAPNGCVLFDGVRWSTDWYLPAAQRTDYSIEVITDAGETLTADASQRNGAPPLEIEDAGVCSVFYVNLRVRRNVATPVGAVPDAIEIGVATGELEYSGAAFSAAAPVVDSRNAGLVAVGAVDPPAGAAIAPYSSQGPTNDGRTKPDVSAPAGFVSQTYGGATFSGTSAASPVAAGIAALLQGAGVAKGIGTAAMVRHFVTDLGPPGRDNAFGSGKVLLPAPPPPAAAITDATYEPLGVATRILDTRAGSHIGPPALVGPFPPESVIDLTVLGTGGVPASGVSAVAVNITSTTTGVNGYLQAVPYLKSPVGATSTLNISTPGQPRPNFAIVPVGVDGKISLYLQAGGNVVVDVLGWFADGQLSAINDGRFVALDIPERWMDTRSAPLPASFSGAPRRVAAGEAVVVPTLGATTVPLGEVSALVVNVTAVNGTGTGFLRALPTGSSAQHSTVNFTPASASANTAIVPLGTGGTISVVAMDQAANVIVDVVGYITNAAAPSSTAGLFHVITPGRAYDTRLPPPAPFAQNELRVVQLTGLPAPAIPAGAAAVSANLTVVAPSTNGFLKAFAGTEPSTSTLNFAGGKTVANGTLLGLDGAGTVKVRMSESGHVIIDVNGYFLDEVT